MPNKKSGIVIVSFLVVLGKMSIFVNAGLRVILSCRQNCYGCLFVKGRGVRFI